MKSYLSIILFLIFIPNRISCSEYRIDTVELFLKNQPKIAIDMTGYRSSNKTNYELKKKNFKPGSRRFL